MTANLVRGLLIAALALLAPVAWAGDDKKGEAEKPKVQGENDKKPEVKSEKKEGEKKPCPKSEKKEGEKKGEGEKKPEAKKPEQKEGEKKREGEKKPEAKAVKKKVEGDKKPDAVAKKPEAKVKQGGKAGAKHVRGEITTVDAAGKVLVLAVITKKQPSTDKKLTVADDAKITIKGEAKTLADVAVGAKAHVTLSADGSKAVAIQIGHAPGAKKKKMPAA